MAKQKARGRGVRRAGPKRGEDAQQQKLAIPGDENFDQPHLTQDIKDLLEPHYRTIQRRAKLSQVEAEEHQEIVDLMIGHGCVAGQRAYFQSGAYIELEESPAKLEGKYHSPKPPKKDGKPKGKPEEGEGETETESEESEKE